MQAAVAAIRILAQRFRRRRAILTHRRLVYMITKTISLLSAGASRRRTRDFKWTKIRLVQSYLRERPLTSAGSAVLLLIGLTFGVSYYHHAQSHESTDDAFIGGYITQVAPEVAGKVVRLNITDNQHVEVGDLLLELDSRDFEARLAKARAALQVAEATYRASRATIKQTRMTTRGSIVEASSGVTAAQAAREITRAQIRAAQDRERQTQAAIETAQAQLAAAEAENKRANDDAQRYQSLCDQGMVSHQQRDQAKTAAQMANARLTAALSQVKSARAAAAVAAAELVQATTQAEQAQAHLEQGRGRLTGASAGPQQVIAIQEQASSAFEAVNAARADVEMAELQLSYTKIHATVSGCVTRRSVEVGDYVQIAQPLMALVQGDLYVTANFKETQLTHIRPGQPVVIIVDAYPGKTFTGKVESIQSGAGSAFSLMPPENATGNYVKIVQRVPVKIVFDQRPDSSYPLGPGMSVVPEVRVR